jgi:ABC-type lipoprotein release transport system permease subunit
MSIVLYHTFLNNKLASTCEIHKGDAKALFLPSTSTNRQISQLSLQIITSVRSYLDRRDAPASSDPLESATVVHWCPHNTHFTATNRNPYPIQIFKNARETRHLCIAKSHIFSQLLPKKNSNLTYYPPSTYS